MIKRQFTLYVENKPGALARVTSLLSRRHINIEGISIAVTGEVGLIQLVVDNAAATEKVLTGAKIPYTEQKVSVLLLPNRPGSLAALAEKLAGRSVNLNYLYATTCSSCRGETSLVVSGGDLKLIESLDHRRGRKSARQRS